MKQMLKDFLRKSWSEKFYNIHRKTIGGASSWIEKLFSGWFWKQIFIICFAILGFFEHIVITFEKFKVDKKHLDWGVLWESCSEKNCSQHSQENSCKNVFF